MLCACNFINTRGIIPIWKAKRGKKVMEQNLCILLLVSKLTFKYFEYELKI
jgi:hypothetical protein